MRTLQLRKKENAHSISVNRNHYYLDKHLLTDFFEMFLASTLDLLSDTILE